MSQLRALLPTLAIGTVGGTVFALLSMPLAWMLGAMVFTTVAAMGGRELVIAENGEQIQRAKDRMLGGRERIGKAWDALGPMLVQPRGKELFAEVLDSRQRFIPAQNRLVELVNVAFTE